MTKIHASEDSYMLLQPLRTISVYKVKVRASNEFVEKMYLFFKRAYTFRILQRPSNNQLFNIATPRQASFQHIHLYTKCTTTYIGPIVV